MTKKQALRTIPYIVVLLLLAVAWLRWQERTVSESTQVLMDTFVTIHLEQPAPPNFMAETFAFMRSRDSLYSPSQENSIVSEIKKLPSNHPLLLDKPTYQLMQLAQQIAQQSKGAFDPTIGAVSFLWKNAQQIPDSLLIQQKLSHIDYQLFQLEQNRFLSLMDSLHMDLGGIGKGAVVDETVQFLKQHHHQNGLINAGGDIRTFGDKTYRIGIQHPRNPDSLLTVLAIQNQAVVSSGDYERYFIHNGIRYHHLLNPQTGYPVQNGMVSVTVVAPQTALADALATTLFVLGPQQGMLFLNHYYPQVEAIFVYENNQQLEMEFTAGIAALMDE